MAGSKISMRIGIGRKPSVLTVALRRFLAGFLTSRCRLPGQALSFSRWQRPRLRRRRRLKMMVHRLRALGLLWLPLRPHKGSGVAKGAAVARPSHAAPPPVLCRPNSKHRAEARGGNRHTGSGVFAPDFVGWSTILPCRIAPPRHRPRSTRFDHNTKMMFLVDQNSNYGILHLSISRGHVWRITAY